MGPSVLHTRRQTRAFTHPVEHVGEAGDIRQDALPVVTAPPPRAPDICHKHLQWNRATIVSAEALSMNNLNIEEGTSERSLGDMVESSGARSILVRTVCGETSSMGRPPTWLTTQTIVHKPRANQS
jgi:hypothetical protein